MVIVEVTTKIFCECGVTFTASLGLVKCPNCKREEIFPWPKYYHEHNQGDRSGEIR